MARPDAPFPTVEESRMITSMSSSQWSSSTKRSSVVVVVWVVFARPNGHRQARRL
jgi:hypothetical protein